MLLCSSGVRLTAAPPPSCRPCYALCVATLPTILAQINDIAAGAKRIYLRPEHVNTITDIVCIPEKELVVTSSLDRRVCVWQV